jgi:hypothetical protein
VEALSLCIEHNIPVTEDLAEKLTMNKGEGDEATRVKILEKVAEGALAQGNYHLATKKFTQAGNKVCHIQPNVLCLCSWVKSTICFALIWRELQESWCMHVFIFAAAVVVVVVVVAAAAKLISSSRMSTSTSEGRD